MRICHTKGDLLHNVDVAIVSAIDLPHCLPHRMKHLPHCPHPTTYLMTVPGYHSDQMRCESCGCFVSWVAKVVVEKKKRGKKNV